MTPITKKRLTNSIDIAMVAYFRLILVLIIYFFRLMQVHKIPVRPIKFANYKLIELRTPIYKLVKLQICRTMSSANYKLGEQP